MFNGRGDEKNTPAKVASPAHVSTTQLPF